eukprot:tig00020614_g12149.t1
MLRRAEGAAAPDPVNEFFTEARIRALAELLVSRYLPLARDELAEWESDPEAFVRGQQGGAEGDQETVRGGAERLLLTLAEVRREVMGPLAAGMLQAALGSTSGAAGGLPGALLKDACYAALGLAADSVFDHVDFAAWYASHLGREAGDRSREPAARLIRRRAVWLLGCWLRKVTDETRASVYRQVVEALASSDDVAVQLTAAETLKNFMNDCRFHVPSFGPLVEPALRSTLELLARVEQPETKLALSGTLCLLVETVGARVQPHLPGLLAGLHALWSAPCEGHALIRTNVVVAATKLVAAVGAAPALFEFVLPLIRHATDVACDEELYLLEDGLELWGAAMSHAAAMSPPLMALYPHVTALLRRDFDHLRECMQLTESYVLLGGAAFMQQHAAAVAEAFALVVGEVKDRGTIAAANVMESLVLVFPQEGPPLLEPVFAKFLPLLLAGSESDVAAASYLSLLARVLLLAPAYFRGLLARAPGPAGAPLLPALLDLWLDKVDCIAAAGKRKLTALALASTLSWGDPAVLSRVGLIIDVAINVMLEVESNPLDPHGDEWASAGPAEPDEDGVVPPQASESGRKAELRGRDPVYLMNLRAYLMERLAELQRAMGDAQFHALMAGVDPAITAQLQAAMSGTLSAPASVPPPPSLP